MTQVSWQFWGEIGVSLYLLSAAAIVLFAIRRLFAWIGTFIKNRYQLTSSVSVGLCEALPWVLFILFALPVGLAFSNVHRFKLPNMSDPKRAFGRDFDDVSFVSADGTSLHGWWMPAKKPSTRTLIMCHGVGENSSKALGRAEVGDWLDANVFMFDLRGHGESGGHSVTLGCREKDDVLAAIDFVRRHHPEQTREVFGLGISLGAVNLAQAQPRSSSRLSTASFSTVASRRRGK